MVSSTADPVLLVTGAGAGAGVGARVWPESLAASRLFLLPASASSLSALVLLGFLLGYRFRLHSCGVFAFVWIFVRFCVFVAWSLLFVPSA